MEHSALVWSAILVTTTVITNVFLQATATTQRELALFLINHLGKLLVIAVFLFLFANAYTTGQKTGDTFFVVLKAGVTLSVSAGTVLGLLTARHFAIKYYCPRF
jgi:hypothetical protein